ncbi:MAG: hypothetical protein ACYS0C_00540 [Planctomycetota bacterium]|jgi:TRAP-type uncharacterized transport system fused permease subunit
MPLNIRPIATSIAVICFFGISVIGWTSGHSPFTCCKRALAGAVFAYIAATLAVKAINAILMNAMITNQIKKQKEKGSGGTG